MACCSNCGSSNISFRRENVGEIRGKGAMQVVHRTVGYCKDCGNTWVASSDDVSVPRKRNTLLWILGWLIIFPVPLTILMLRKKDLRPVFKYSIIAIAWIFYLFIQTTGASSKKADTSTSTSPQATVEAQTGLGKKMPESSEAPQENEGKNLSIDEIVAIYKSSLDSSFKDRNIDYSITEEEKLITISVWSDGLTQEALLAQSDEQKKQGWDKMAESLIKTQNTFQGLMDRNGHEDVLVAIGILNDVNKENHLLYVGRGKVLYDSVNDINLLG